MRKLFLILMLCFLISSVKAAEPTFNYIDSDWLQPISQDMSLFWEMAGLQETGMNYYSTANGSPYWERFNPESPRYQAWFGVYVVDNFEFAEEWNTCGSKSASMQRTIELTMADQIAWLTFFGNPDPYPVLVENSIFYYRMRNGWYNLFYTLNSSSDLGDIFNPYLPMCPDYSLYSSLVGPYHDITLYCNVRFKYENGKFLVIYSSVSQYQLSDGTWKFPRFYVLGEISRMMSGITFSK